MPLNWISYSRKNDTQIIVAKILHVCFHFEYSMCKKKQKQKKSN
mgnify:CR=1 FL=1